MTFFYFFLSKINLKSADTKSMAQKKNSKKSTKKSNGTLFTTACVVLGLLVILIVFLVKKDQIFTNLKETAFFDKVFGTTPEMIEKHEPAAPKQTEVVQLKEDVVIQIEPEKKTAPVPAEKPQSAAVKEEAKETKPAEKEEKVVTKEEPKKETPKVTAKTDLQLCFVVIDGDGTVGRKVIKRSVPKPDSPLTTSINLLLKGPDVTQSAEKNCMSVIPNGTKLLSAKVQGGVAYLSFNDKLEYNELGVEGTIHSLEQIVYTATAFSTVTSVQILIDGEKRDYLGSEGQWIGSPLSRQSF